MQKAESYKGGMHRKRSKGRQYLFRKLDRLGHGKSLGPRSPDTEKIIDAFQLVSGTHMKSEVKTYISYAVKSIFRLHRTTITRGI